jgi:RNA polymerase sigma factor (sigma-70 family)
LNAFRGLRRGIDVETESAWLFKIAHNVCLTRRRSAWRRGKVETPNDMEALQDFVAAPQRMGTDELIQLQEALAGMPANQRKAVLLREWQGLSYHEIAEQMELSQAAVETLIFRGRQTLARGLEQAPEERRSWRRVRHTMDVGAALMAVKAALLGGAAAKVAATTAAVTVFAVVPAGIEQNRVAATPRTPVAQEPVAASKAQTPVAVAQFVVPAAEPAEPFVTPKPAPAPKRAPAPKPEPAPPAPAPIAEAPAEPDPATEPAPAAEAPVAASAPPAVPEAEQPKADRPKQQDPVAVPAPSVAEEPPGKGRDKEKEKRKSSDRAPQAAKGHGPKQAMEQAQPEPQQPAEPQPVEAPEAEQPQPEHGGGKPDKPEKDKGGPKK